jgi:hypothetical protein
MSSQDPHLAPSPRSNTPNAKSSSSHSDHSQPHSSDSNSNHIRQPGSNNGLSSTYVVLACMIMFSSLSRACYACAKPMHGPFVRALGSVYHLNCFKCLVCCSTSSSCIFSTSVGLRRSRCIKVLPHRQPKWKAKPPLRERLLQTTQSHMCKMWNGVEGELYHRLQSVFLPFLSVYFVFMLPHPQTKNTTSNTLHVLSAPPSLAHMTPTTNTMATYTAISTTQRDSLRNAPAAPAPSSNSLSRLIAICGTSVGIQSVT